MPDEQQLAVDAELALGCSRAARCAARDPETPRAAARRAPPGRAPRRRGSGARTRRDASASSGGFAPQPAHGPVLRDGAGELAGDEEVQQRRHPRRPRSRAGSAPRRRSVRRRRAARARGWACAAAPAPRARRARPPGSRTASAAARTRRAASRDPARPAPAKSHGTRTRANGGTARQPVTTRSKPAKARTMRTSVAERDAELATLRSLALPARSPPADARSPRRRRLGALAAARAGDAACS